MALVEAVPAGQQLALAGPDHWKSVRPSTAYYPVKILISNQILPNNLDPFIHTHGATRKLSAKTFLEIHHPKLGFCMMPDQDMERYRGAKSRLKHGSC